MNTCPQLKTIYYHITNKCNLKCKHCWVDAKSDFVNTLSLNEAKNVILQAIPLGLKTIKISGGEPFIVPWLLDFVDFANDHDIACLFETNGTLVTSRISNRLAKLKISHISVSLDGSSAYIHETLRGTKGCFEATICGIKKLVEARLKVVVLTAVYKDNLSDLPAIISLVENIGAQCIKFNIISQMGRGIELADRILTIQEQIKLLDCIEQWQKNTSVQISLSFPLIMCPASKLGQYICTACNIVEMIGLLGDGTLSMCAIGYTDKRTIYGNIRQNSLKDVWQMNPPQLLKQLREGLSYQLTGVCSQCILKLTCKGGCRANAFTEYGSPFAPEPICQKYLEAGLVSEKRLIFEKIAQSHII